LLVDRRQELATGGRGDLLVLQNQRLGEASDRGERRAELMRDDRNEVSLKLLHLFLLRDVSKDRQRMDRPAGLGILDGGEGAADPALRAVRLMEQ
jgi:hypothetical protein